MVGHRLVPHRRCIALFLHWGANVASMTMSVLTPEFGGLPNHARHHKWQRMVQGDDLPLLMPSYAVPLLPTTKVRASHLA